MRLAGRAIVLSAVVLSAVVLSAAFLSAAFLAGEPTAGRPSGSTGNAFSLRSPYPPIGVLLAVVCRRTCPADPGSTREFLHTRLGGRAIAATHSCCLINRTEADRRPSATGEWIARRAVDHGCCSGSAATGAVLRS